MPHSETLSPDSQSPLAGAPFEPEEDANRSKLNELDKLFPVEEGDRHVSMFGEWLRRKRAQKKLTLQELADASGINIGTLSSYERGNLAKIQPTTVAKLSDGLGVSADEIYDIIETAERLIKKSRS